MYFLYPSSDRVRIAMLVFIQTPRLHAGLPEIEHPEHNQDQASKCHRLCPLAAQRLRSSARVFARRVQRIVGRFASRSQERQNQQVSRAHRW